MGAGLRRIHAIGKCDGDRIGAMDGHNDVLLRTETMDRGITELIARERKRR